ncbi:hypothetical protein Tco_0445459 [Tanacetum coccineum]
MIIPVVAINQKIHNSISYKTYLAFATGATTPKKARKWKQPSFAPKKKAITVEDPDVAKKKRQQHMCLKCLLTGVLIKDSPGVSVSKKKTPARAKRNTGGSGDGVSFQPEVPDEPKGKSIDTYEGTGLKPGVPDVSKAYSLDSEYESWGGSADDDDDQQGDDKRTDSDNQKTNDKAERLEDKFIHTPKDYVPTNDETTEVDDEEYRKTNKEIHTTALATTIPQILPPLFPILQQLTLIPTLTTTEATTSTTAILKSSTLFAIHQRVSDLEKEVKIVRNVDQNLADHVAIKSEVPIVIK